MLFNPDYAVDIVARRRKPLRNARLERFWFVGILINMSRAKIVKQALQHGFSSRSRFLLHNLGLISISNRQAENTILPEA